MTRRRAWAVGAAAIVCGAALLGPAAASGELPATAHPGVSAAAAEPSPVPTSAQGPADRARDLVADMTTTEQALSVVMGHIPSPDPQELAAYMAQGLGGFILMGANIPPTEAELAMVTAAVAGEDEVPPLVAIDQEGGLVSRIHDDGAASTTLKSEPVAATSAAFAARGSLVAQAGIGVNFGTVADVPADPSSFIHGRALGTDPVSAAERVAASTVAQEQFLASTLKHFPGHGAAPGDSHHAIPTTTEPFEEWQRTDAVPFDAGIAAGASLLMFGHLAYTAVDPAPASLSARWHQIAREDLGFEGVIVTDDLGMLQSSGLPEYADPVANAVAAIAAGSDLVLLIAGSTPDTAAKAAAGIAAAVESGALPADRLAEAATRVMTLRMRSAAATAEWTPCPECEPVG